MWLQALLQEKDAEIELMKAKLEAKESTSQSSKRFEQHSRVSEQNSKIAQMLGWFHAGLKQSLDFVFYSWGLCPPNPI